MPTNANGYNSRVTDEALEKRFRDTFRAQGGAELVDDLYAQGVIVPVVDFTAAATGQQLSPELAQAWDFSTGKISVTNNTPQTVISNAGFWKLHFNVALNFTADVAVQFDIFDGSTAKNFWSFEEALLNPSEIGFLDSNPLIVFLRSGDSVRCRSKDATTAISYRQIADISGNVVNPSGFTSS